MFESISSYTTFPADKIRYAFLLLFSYPLAIIFRHILHYDKTTPIVRHVYLGGLGILFSILCFGWQTCFLIGMVISSYSLLFILPLRRVQWCTMIFAMVMMGTVHIYRMITDYEGWTLDFSGPFMMLVQRITYVGFSYHDGETGRKDLNKDQEYHKLENVPSFIEYMSYCFNFLSFLTGPSSTFTEYNEMVTGRNFKKYGTAEPSALLPALRKFGVAMVMIILFVYFESFHDLRAKIFDDSIPMYIKIFIIYAYSLSLRGRYYFAFFTAESVCNVAGFGFNGYDESNNSRWDLMVTMGLKGSEFPINFRELSATWNSATSKWLRRCIYERVQFNSQDTLTPTLMTFLVSAVWHGFYPVYYYTFIVLFIGIMAARKMRGRVRPFFQGSPSSRIFYDIVTTLVTIVCRDYFQLIFMFLNVQESLKFASYYYHLPSLLFVLVVLIVSENTKTPCYNKEKAS